MVLNTIWEPLVKEHFVTATREQWNEGAVSKLANSEEAFGK